MDVRRPQKMVSLHDEGSRVLGHPGLVFRYVPCCLQGAFLLLDAVPKTGTVFKGFTRVAYHIPRRVGSMIRVPRQVLGLRFVVRAVTSAHAS